MNGMLFRQASKWGHYAMMPALLTALWLASFNQALAQPAAASANDESAFDRLSREEILASDRWKQAIAAFNHYLDHQQLYSKTDVAAMRKDLDARTKKMPADELRQFLVDMEGKLEILIGPEMRETTAWLNEYLAVLSDKKIKELRGRLPNLLDATPDEIAAQLQMAEDQRALRSQRTSDYYQRQAQLVQQMAADERAEADSQRRARITRPAPRGNSVASPQFASPYAPRPYRPPAGPRFSVGPFGGVTMFYGGYRW